MSALHETILKGMEQEHGQLVYRVIEDCVKQAIVECFRTARGDLKPHDSHPNGTMIRQWQKAATAIFARFPEAFEDLDVRSLDGIIEIIKKE